MLYIIMGKSAAGKDKIFRLIRDLRLAKPIILATTRPPRDKEMDGKDYYFKSKQEFANMIINSELLEYRSYITNVNGVRDEWFYGTLKTSIDPSIDQVIVLPPEGAAKLIRENADITHKIVLVTASDRTRSNRAKKRGSFDETEWNRRITYDNLDFSHADEITDIIFDNDADADNNVLIHRIKTEIFDSQPGTPTDVELTPYMLHKLEKAKESCRNVIEHVYDDGMKTGTSGILITCDKLIEQIDTYLKNN